jgi:hypothetical protein
MMIIKAHPLMEVLGYLATIMLDVLNGAVPGTILRVVAVLRLAASVPPAIVSSISVFELCVRFRGLCNPLPFYSLALFSIFFTLYILAESESIYFYMNDLPIIQKAYDLIKWYVPILERLPQRHRFTLGERITNELYDLLEGLITARYAKHKLPQLEDLNTRLEILRHQTRLLLDFELIAVNRYEFAGKAINAIGTDLGGWIKQQRQGTT